MQRHGTTAADEESARQGHVLRGLRERAGMGLGELASVIGCHRNYVSMVERGVRRASPALVTAWLEATGGTFADLFGRDLRAAADLLLRIPPERMAFVTLAMRLAADASDGDLDTVTKALGMMTVAAVPSGVDD